MVNVGLIGHGYWGTILEKYIKADKNFNLKYVCDSKSNLNEVWDDKTVKAVVVVVRNEQRCAIVERALLSGKDVLTEKPLAMTSIEAEQLAWVAKEKKLNLVVDYTFMVSKSIQIARDLAIYKRRIGKIIGFDISVNHLAPFGGGSVYWILGSHMLSVLDMFIPLETLTFKRKDIVVYKGNIETGVISTDRGQIYLSLNYPAKTVEFVLYGTIGTIVYNPNKKESLIVENYDRPAWIRDVPKQEKIFEIDESNNLKYVMEYFNDVINNKAKSNVDTAIKITKILEDLHDSKVN
jgi:predicted dehydrogenase